MIKGNNNTPEVGRDVNNINTNEKEKHTRTRLNVTIAMRFPRKDRLGSNVQRPLLLMAYSHCMGYNFCIGSGRAGVSEVFGFPTCPANITDVHVGRIFETEVNRSGFYDFVRDEVSLLKAVSENVECALSASFRKTWRDMVFSAPQFQDPNAVASQDLFRNTTSAVTVAVHIRRGDIADGNPIFILDNVFVSIIKDLQERLAKAGRESEVHVFSEDYGFTNWTAYEGLVDKDKMHLAPRNQKKHAMDMDLNLRDWKHFINADVLVAGGTFSRIASYARDEADKVTGLPLTIHPCGLNRSGTFECTNAAHFTWSGAFFKHHNRDGLMEGVEYVNLPAVFGE